MNLTLAPRWASSALQLSNNSYVDCGTIIKVNDDLNIRVKGHTCPYVSRGGYKLEKAIKSFNMDFLSYFINDLFLIIIMSILIFPLFYLISILANILFIPIFFYSYL